MICCDIHSALSQSQNIKRLGSIRWINAKWTYKSFRLFSQDFFFSFCIWKTTKKIYLFFSDSILIIEQNGIENGIFTKKKKKKVSLSHSESCILAAFYAAPRIYTHKFRPGKFFDICQLHLSKLISVFFVLSRICFIFSSVSRFLSPFFFQFRFLSLIINI